MKIGNGALMKDIASYSYINGTYCLTCKEFRTSFWADYGDGR